MPDFDHFSGEPPFVKGLVVLERLRYNITAGIFSGEAQSLGRLSQEARQSGEDESGDQMPAKHGNLWGAFLAKK
jgi:hypothetical protein